MEWTNVHQSLLTQLQRMVGAGGEVQDRWRGVSGGAYRTGNGESVGPTGERGRTLLFLLPFHAGHTVVEQPLEPELKETSVLLGFGLKPRGSGRVCRGKAPWHQSIAAQRGMEEEIGRELINMQKN